ncbi:MAG: thioredoxin [Caldimonas sp.]|uniref:TlpA family protein disulfide reductase n=1 Tax=Caldimonas TaxID=196013 RepID=UPI000362D797|nr:MULTISPECIES: TlpA disulfide reductase family protein [Caldimonas]GIX23086.1 MAG: thioredoxin [Caldimonas sp.]
MNRRHALSYAGAALAAALAGAGLAWWRWRPTEAAAHAATTLFSQTFDSPEGSPLALRQFAGRPLVVNFWATWCPPCVREMPELDRFYRGHRAQGWQVLGVAIDQPQAVREFLLKVPVSFPIAIAGFAGTELAKALGNTSGALPFTVALNASGEITHRKLGETSYDELLGWVQPLA